MCKYEYFLAWQSTSAVEVRVHLTEHLVRLLPHNDGNSATNPAQGGKKESSV